MITLVIMNKNDSGSVTGDTTVSVQFLADQCKKSDLNVSTVWVSEYNQDFIMISKERMSFKV